jgi:hypothetical protein
MLGSIHTESIDLVLVPDPLNPFVQLLCYIWHCLVEIWQPLHTAVLNAPLIIVIGDVAGFWLAACEQQTAGAAEGEGSEQRINPSTGK